MNDFFKLTSALKKSWDVKVLSYNAYDTELFYKTMEKYRDNEVPDSDIEIENFTRAIIICTVIEMERRWFAVDDTGRYEYQRDVLAKTVVSTAKYYSENQNAFFEHNTEPPTTDELKEKLHDSIKWKARREILSNLKEFTKEEKQIRENQIRLKDEMREDDSQYPSLDQIIDSMEQNLNSMDYTDLDSHIVSAALDKATVTAESTDLISKFFLENKEDVEQLIPMFKNKRIAEMDPKNLWKIRVFNWEAATVYSYLEKIDLFEPLTPDEKGYLYMFYLMICIAALHHERHGAVKGLAYEDEKGRAISANAMVIGRKYIPALTTLVIKTFLHFTKKLEQNVFSNFDPPPPISPKEVKAFRNIIKEKPRKLLETSVKLPPVSGKKPILATTQKMMQAIMSDEFEIPEIFNFEEVFESYSVFEALTNNIMQSFSEGRIKDQMVDDTEALSAALRGMNEADLRSVLKAVLSASGYKIEKDGEKENGFVISGRKVADTSVGYEPDERTYRIAVSLNCSKAFGRTEADLAVSHKKQQKTDRVLMVSTQNYAPDFKDVKRKMRDFETWDLLDLVEMIQRNYQGLSESEKKLIDDYIDKTLDEF